MGKKSADTADIKEIMKDIKKKAHGEGYVCDFAGFDEVADLREKKQSAVNENELRQDIEVINREYYVGYDKAVDIGSPIRAKLGSMIRVRVIPLLEKRNRWSASIVRLFNQLSTEVSEVKQAVDESDPQLLKVQLNELELKFHTAVKQMEIMNSRITELEKALKEKDENR